MSYNKYALASLMLSASTAMASNAFVKRDSWGAAFSLGPAKQEIIQTTTTIYPGKMPSGQEAYLFAWLGISNGTGDLIQSIVGSYPAGGSECGGQSAADTTWCISSEVYGSGYQYTGELTTAMVNYENGILLNYTLADPDTYLWTQTMSDAVTGTLLSSFNKTSGPMLGWGTALECNDNDSGVACTGTDQEQYYLDSTIKLKAADSTFSETLGAGTGVTHSDMTTTDGGLTWTIAKIAIPPMVTNSETAAEVTPGAVAASSASSVKSSSVASASHAAVTVSSSSSAAAVVPTSSSASVAKANASTKSASKSGFKTSVVPASTAAAAVVATSAASSSAGSVALYGNCSGGKTCSEGTCVAQNSYYSQCVASS